MIGRFVRFASIGFAVFSAIYWLSVWTFVEMIELLNERLTEATVMDRIAQAIPAVIYGLVCVWFCNWFAKGIVRRIDIKGPFE